MAVGVTASGALMFGGAALADCGPFEGAGGGQAVAGNSGGSGTGGNAVNNCVNVGVPILSGIGVAGSGSASGASCGASANGVGGNAS